jgi:nitrogenase-associated protein
MVEVIFFGKPDCPASAKQKAQLKAAGHHVLDHDIGAEDWTAERLKSFFGDRPTEDWFNRTHPSIRSGDIDRRTISAERALAALIADPELIRRPLLQVGERREFGFDPVRIGAWIGIDPIGDESCEAKHSRGICDHGHR